MGVQCFVDFREVCGLVIGIRYTYASQATPPKYDTITHIFPFHRRPRRILWPRSPSSRYFNGFLRIIFLIINPAQRLAASV